MEFLEALADPAIPFLRYALAVGILASLSFGIIGTYVVARRITYIAGAISHCVLGSTASTSWESPGSDPCPGPSWRRFWRRSSSAW